MRPLTSWLAMLAVAGLAGWSIADETAQIEFTGNAQFSRADLIRALRRYSVLPQGDFARTTADDAAYFLREFYFSQGFPEAEVGYAFSPDPSRVEFSISEGEMDWIGGVTVAGATAITTARILEIFDAAVRQATLRPFGRLRFVESAIEQGRQSVARAFGHDGFLDVEIHIETRPGAPDSVDLAIQIDEGVQFILEKIEIRGAPDVGDGIRDLFERAIGAPYRLNEENSIGLRAESFLQNHGFFHASVDTAVELDRESGNVVIDLEVNPGPAFRIGEIRVEGNQDTLADAVRRRFAIRPGSVFNQSALDEGARRLWFSGAFAEADVETTPRDDGLVDVDLKLVEARAKQVRFNLGYSEWEQVFAEIHYIDRNFFGTLNRFSVDAFISMRGYGASTALASPWMFGLDATGSVGLQFSQRELPAYKSFEFGVPLKFERRFDSSTLTNYRVGYLWKRVDGEALGEDSAEANPDYTFGGVLFGQTYDTRNDILSPMKGWFLDYEIELASPVLLGDLSFFRIEGQITKYFPLRPITPERPFVPFVVLNHRSGILEPFADTGVIPIQERFFLGGPNTVRSFQLDGLGPRDSSGIPLGGLAMFLLNAEIQWPVFKNIYLAAFVDAGNLAPSLSQIDLDDTQVGVGPGLRIYTPIGAVRVDYGYNLNRQDGDPIGAWQFGFGFTF